VSGRAGDQADGQEGEYVARGFLTVVLVVVAVGALALWLWLRPLREGPAQAVGLWLGCLLMVGAVVLVWAPTQRHHERGRPRTREWLVVAGVVVVSGLMALIGVVVTREDRRPALRDLVESAVADQPVGFVGETTWAYQPRFVGDLGRKDWSVCRSYRVAAGDPQQVVAPVEVALLAAGVDAGEVEHVPGDGTWRYSEVTVDGPNVVVCVLEVDPEAR
jgi:uncharacterized membrane protein YidH (DUF202 family)